MELPERKQIRLNGYDYSQNGAYFMTICTKDRRNMLGKIVVGGDAHIAPWVELSPYGRVAEKYIQRIETVRQYRIMPNHLHMIMCLNKADGPMWASAPTQSVSQIIKSFKILVAKEIGVSIWQRSFYDHIIRNENEFEKIWQYIDDNPARWAEDEYFI